MKKQLTIGRQILLGFGILLALLCVVAAIACRGLYTTRDDFKDYRTLARHSVLAGRVQANFLDMRISVKEYQQTKAEKSIKEYEERAEKTKRFLADADAQITDPEQAALIDKMLAGVEEHMRGFKELVPALQDPAGAARAVQIEEKMRAAGQLVGDVAEECKLLIVAQQDKLGPKAEARVVQTVTIMMIAAISALAVGLGSAWLIVRRTTRTLGQIAQALGDGAEQVASASTQSSSASQSLAEGASEQAASLEETSASLEEVASMAKHNAENAEKAKSLSAQTRIAADSGAAEMEAMRRAMDDIKTSSNEVAKILKSIDDIAFQTNILALNAAVEAARAGEAGMGFSVVAEEVRNLAQRSATSAKETAAKISDAISKSEHGVQISGKVAASLSEIVEKARNVDSLVGEIAAASVQQNQGLSQVNTAVSQMDKVTQSTAGNAEETAAASEELSSQAEMMRQSVRDLLAFVGTSTERPNDGARREQSGLKRPAGIEAGSAASRPAGAKGIRRSVAPEPATPLS